MTEHVTTSTGDVVAYDHHGEAGQPAIVFIAGAGPFRAVDPVTTETARLLAERGIQSTVHDRVGRGESEAKGSIPLERELAAIAALIDVVGGRAVLCGHSSGCSIALAAAAGGLPVAGLALWEAPLGPVGGESAEWWAECARRMEAGDLQGALAHYMKDMPPEWLEEAMHSPEFPMMAADVPTYRPDGESLAWAETASLATLLDGVDAPVHAIVGTETFDSLLEGAARIAEELPGATHRRVAGAEHSWDPAAMAEELESITRSATA